ncbi:MAG: rRNA (guanine1207-N2)-methyltransferase [Actinomycetota bacterium]|nr:rRNA (guanine1207-N2)-methyltransferase [Actinomycetota bacterium]
MQATSVSGQYFEEEPSVTSAPRTVRLVLPDRTLDLVTDRGVFAKDDVDPGTKLLLLEAPSLPETGNLLDLGCGYGPIAVTMAARRPDATVWAVDVNERAVALTRDNAARLGLANVRATTPDDVPDDVRFAALWSNPPIRIGKPALHELLRTWLPRLDAGGEAVLVVHKHLGSDSLASWLGQEGWDVNRRTSRVGYRILSVAR